MRTATKDMQRRAFLATCLALAWSPRLARPGTAPARLAAAWQTGTGYQLGVLEVGTELQVVAAIDIPTRAHALLREPDGHLLAVARRPGDWLLRFSPEGRPLAWRWIEPGRAFAGHALRDEAHLYIAETDLETGQGLLGVRDATSLEKLAEWPSHGLDPHQLVWDLSRPDTLLLANGGVPSRPEAGRRKTDLEHMDSSLVRLDARTGAWLGQWRLMDRRLSLRHLAWHGTTLGVALQAEHDDPAAKIAAPVLALFDGAKLTQIPAPQPLVGYGGDIAATPEGFVVSCPRAQGVARFSAQGVWGGFIPLAEACALAAAERLWIGGHPLILAMGIGADPITAAAGRRLDNHWIDL